MFQPISFDGEKDITPEIIKPIVKDTLKSAQVKILALFCLKPTIKFIFSKAIRDIFDIDLQIILRNFERVGDIDNHVRIQLSKFLVKIIVTVEYVYISSYTHILLFSIYIFFI